MQQSEPAQAYALDQAAARAAADPDSFAPPYIDPTSGQLVAPVVESASADEASAPIQVTQAPADEGSGVPAEDSEDGTKPDSESSEAETPTLPADGSVETTGEESFVMPEFTPDSAPTPDGPTVTEQVVPHAEVVDHSVTALESVRDEVLQLPEAELPGVSGLHVAYVDAAENRVVVETENAAPALVTALGERYGTDAVAVHVTPGIDTAEPQANRQYDTSPYYGGARIHSDLTTSKAVWCTAGFSWKYAVDSKGNAIAKGILSGGGGGGGDKSGGFLDPCYLYFTDIGLANSAFPGTVAWY
ncbi:hypothetical protein [Streptomyces sp. NPDC003483]